MRYLLTFLLLFGIGFGQKTVTITKNGDTEKKIEVKKEIKDGEVTLSITKDGVTEEFTADLDDTEAIAELDKKLEELDIDADIKIVKKYKKEDSECNHSKYDDDFVWYTKDDDEDKHAKFIKMHEPMLMDEKAGYLGVQIQDLSEQLGEYFKVKKGNGVLVSEVVKDSPAEKAGLKAGDVIIKVDDKDVSNTSELTQVVRGYKPESEVNIVVVRDGKNKTLTATLGETENMFVSQFNIPDEQQMMLKIPEHHNMEDFDFHTFNFDQQEFKAEMENLKKEMEEMKLQLKKLQEEM